MYQQKVEELIQFLVEDMEHGADLYLSDQTIFALEQLQNEHKEVKHYFQDLHEDNF